MTANIEKGAQAAVVAADHKERLAVDVNGEELAGLGNLVEAADHLPVGGEDAAALQLLDARIEIPRRGNGERFLKGISGIVKIQNVANAAFQHGEKLRT